jgi:hypothetical protein
LAVVVLSRRRQLRQSEGQQVRYERREAKPRREGVPRPPAIAWLERAVPLFPGTRLMVLGVASDAPGGMLLLREYEQRAAEKRGER